MNLLKAISPKNTPSSVDTQDVFAVLREQILQYGLLGASAIGAILVPLLIARDIARENYLLVGIYGLAFLSVLAMTVFRQINYGFRTYLFVGLIYIIAMTDLIESGMSGEGRITMMVFVLMNTILAKKNYLGRSIVAGFIALASLTLVGLGMSYDWITLPSVETLSNSGRIGEWLNGNTVFLLMGAVIVSAMLMLLNQTQFALKKQEQFNQELENERNKLQAEFDLQTQAVNRRASEVEAASSLARDISKFTDLDTLLANAVNLIKNQFGFYHSGIFLLDPNKEYAVLRAATGEAGRQMLSQNHRLRVGEVGIVGFTVSKGEARISQDVGLDSFHYKNPILPDTRSELALPLKVSGDVIGALDVQSQQEMAFAPGDVKILQMIADQLAVAINKAQILQKLQQTVTELEARYSQTAKTAWTQYLGGGGQTVSLALANNTFAEATPLLDEEKEAITKQKSVLVTRSTEKNQQKTSLSLPLKLRENLVLGSIRIEFDGENVPPHILEMLESLSNRLALALDRARLMQEIQTTAEQERMVSDVTAKLRASSNIDNILKTAASEIGRSLGAAEVVVQLLPANDK
jgi:GAF domain-containing protein